MIFRTLLVLFTLLLLVPACSHQEGGAPKKEAEGEEQKDSAKAPYYHGLVKEYESLIAQDPRNLAAIIALGNAYYDSGQWKQAVAAYERALAIEPRNTDVRTDMGTALRNMGMSDRAIVEYRRALSYEPGHQNARYNLGVVYAYDKRDYPSAIKTWEDLLRIAPNHPQSENMRSCIITFRKVVKKEE